MHESARFICVAHQAALPVAAGLLILNLLGCGAESAPPVDQCTTEQRVSCQQRYNSCLDGCATASDPSLCTCECTNDLFYCYDALRCDRNPVSSAQECR